MTSVIEYRYQVCDPVCGLFDAYPTKAWAFDAASRHARKGCEGVQTYDVMAHHGKWNTWSADGTPLAIAEIDPTLPTNTDFEPGVIEPRLSENIGQLKWMRR